MWVNYLPTRIIETIKVTLAILFFPYPIIKSFFIERDSCRKFLFQSFLQQAGKSFLQPLLAIILSASLIGGVVISQVQMHLGDFLSFDLTKRVIIYLLLWELCPILVAMIQRSRFGTTLTLELARMKLNHSLSALSTMGVNIEYYFLLPRLAGILCGSLILTFIAAILSLLLGQLFTLLFFSLAHSLSLWDLITAVTLVDILILVTKSCGFSIIIISSQSYFSLSSKDINAEFSTLNARAATYNFLLFFVLSLAISGMGLI